MIRINIINENYLDALRHSNKSIVAPPGPVLAVQCASSQPEYKYLHCAAHTGI